MTDFFRFDDLTWPEVAELPRDIPLVLPLGKGCDEAELAETLSNPPRIGLLPCFPFGWRGSGLEVPEPVLRQYIGNLLHSLREDGFSRVYALMPRDIDLGFGSSQLRAAYHLTPDTLPLPLALPPDSEREKVILLPIGHTEQHAYHLPLSSDCQRRIGSRLL